MWENLAFSHIMTNTLLAFLSSLDTSLQLLNPIVFILVFEISMFNSEQPNIAIIGVIAFLHASKLSGSSNFELYLYFLDIQANFTKLAVSSDLSNVPSNYYKFADIFSKTKAKVLTSHCSYDLKINLKEGTQPLVGLIYSLSASEQETLKEFIKKNLNTNFIQSTLSLYGIPVLFIKKKDRSLCLCVNFCGLECISKKNCYLLLLIFDLLDLFCKAQVYSKIDLYYTYHLVCIADGDEWKTAFRTYYRSFEWSIMPFGLTNTSAAF